MKRKTIAAALAAALLVLALTACLGGAEAPQKNLVRPYISRQPESGSYYTDAFTAPELKIEIWDWNTKDGKLSYQWFRFENIEDYCKTGGTAIPGATKESYTPEITPEAGKIFYYYIVVTNTKKDALDAKSATIQSEVASLAFSAPGDPLFPIISRHPADAGYRWGSALNGIKVEARLPKNASGDAVDGTLTYQWYSNAAFSVTDGTTQAGEDKSAFIPDYDILQIGKNYFYVEATNTVGNKKATAVSVPAVITMELGLKAAAPRIDRQPVDRFYFTAAAIEALTVEASAPDRGELSYEWFSSPQYANASVKDKPGVSVATTESFTPTTGGYYYVVVTNTNNNVSGAKTATVKSKTVQVRITAAGVTPTENMTINIPDPKVAANRKQYIRGFGGMDVAWDNFPRTDPEDTELMYDPERMGYNILRIMIRPDNIDIKKTMADLVSGSRPAFYENVKIVNKYGGYVAASPWTPPKEWKSNNSINGGGNLIPSYYRLFANYLRTFAQHMYDQGAPIYCISISNEPNYVAGYDGCEWSPEEMRDFWIEIGHFTNGIRGYGGGRELPYVLTMNGESANSPLINVAALEDPRSRAVIDILARHIYGSRTESLWNSKLDLLTRADGSKTEVWMTEHNINSANATGYYNDSTWNYVWRFLNDVDLVMRINNENAFVWWASKRFYSMVGDGQFGATHRAPLPRGWTLTHYSRYAIDTDRINFPNGSITGNMRSSSAVGYTTPIGNIERPQTSIILNNTADNMDNTSARVTAFSSQDRNEISVILWTPTDTSGNGGWDMGTVKINLPAGFEAKGVTAHRSKKPDTTAQGTVFHYFEPDDSVILSSDRNTAYLTMPRGELLSVKFTNK